MNSGLILLIVTVTTALMIFFFLFFLLGSQLHMLWTNQPHRVPCTRRVGTASRKQRPRMAYARFGYETIGAIEPSHPPRRPRTTRHHV